MTDAVLQRYENSEAYRTMVAEQRAADLATRRRLLAERDQEHGRHARALPPIDGELKRLDAERASAENAVRAIDQKLLTATAARLAEQGAHRNALARIDRELTECADHSTIDEFVRELEREIQRARGKVETTARPGKLNPHTEQQTMTSLTNGPAVLARIEALQSAERSALALKDGALSRSEIDERIAQLRASLPRLDASRFDVITEQPVEILKPTPRSVGNPTEVRA